MTNHQPVQLDEPRRSRTFKHYCTTCFIVLRAIPRVFDEIPHHLRDLSSEVRDAWRESANL